MVLILGLWLQKASVGLLLWSRTPLEKTIPIPELQEEGSEPHGVTSQQVKILGLILQRAVDSHPSLSTSSPSRTPERTSAARAHLTVGRDVTEGSIVQEVLGARGVPQLGVALYIPGGKLHTHLAALRSSLTLVPTIHHFKCILGSAFSSITPLTICLTCLTSLQPSHPFSLLSGCQMLLGKIT